MNEGATSDNNMMVALFPMHSHAEGSEKLQNCIQLQHQKWPAHWIAALIRPMKNSIVAQNNISFVRWMHHLFAMNAILIHSASADAAES